MAERKPDIRFKGFNDDWEQRKVSDITKFHKQGYYTTESYDENKKYYLLRGTDLTENRLVLKDTPKIDATENDYKAFKTELGDFLIVRSGTVGTYGIVDVDIPAIFGSYLIDFRFNKSVVTNEFFGYFYQSDLFKEQLRKIIQQSANTNINAENIKSTQINLPSIHEQKKIARFLESLDHLITLHQRKYDKLLNIKKSMLEKMFPKNGADVPEIRFKGFTGAWQQRKLGDITDRVVRKNKDNQSTLPLTISAQYGLVDQVTFFNNRVASRDVSNYYLIKKGEFAYNKSYSDGYPFGAVKRLERYEMGVLSTLYIVFSLKEDIINSDFVVSYYDTNNWHKEVAERAAEGARNHGLLNISANDFFDTKLSFPKDLVEQAKIGAYFKQLDHLITLHKRKLEKLKNIKKSCLEKMFV